MLKNEGVVFSSHFLDLNQATILDSPLKSIFLNIYSLNSLTSDGVEGRWRIVPIEGLAQLGEEILVSEMSTQEI